ncbi:hypothetical protein SDC9_97507 [bioreactor metagenome]|uniref:Uncharacterized protein n=1 Tax=bioreactor metagenome TaxID=1076179 RepID=A0A645AMB1_9ZZZZ
MQGHAGKGNHADTQRKQCKQVAPFTCDKVNADVVVLDGGGLGGQSAIAVLQRLLEILHNITRCVGAEIVSGVPVDLIDHHAGGAAVNGRLQAGVGNIRDFIQVTHFGALGRCGVRGLVKCVPLRGHDGLGRLELEQHVGVCKVLLPGARTALVKGGNFVKDIGVDFAQHIVTGNRDGLLLAAPVTTEDDGGFETGVKVGLGLLCQLVIGGKLGRGQVCFGILVRVLLDLGFGEAFAKRVVQNVDLHIVQGQQAGVHIHDSGSVFGPLRVADHANAGLVDIVEGAHILQRVIQAVRRVAEVRRFRCARTVGRHA